jgi:hypothetical protein
VGNIRRKITIAFEIKLITQEGLKPRIQGKVLLPENKQYDKVRKA